jgi:hypothetical protein
VSDDCCTTSVYYEPPPSHPNWDWDIPWPLVLPIILFVAALIWLWYLTPEKKKEEKKTVTEQITAAFTQASNDADAYTRPEVQRPLARVRDKVLDILRAEGIK